MPTAGSEGAGGYFGNFVLVVKGLQSTSVALPDTVWRQASLSEEPDAWRNLLLYFEHDEVDIAFESIAPDVELNHSVERQAWGQRVFRFYDPDGHAVKVGEPQNLTTSENSRNL